MSLRISGCKTLKHQYIFIWGGIDVKNRMKKRCMASILALVMMCLLGACGTDKADTKLYQKESKETDSSSTQDDTSEDKMCIRDRCYSGYLYDVDMQPGGKVHTDVTDEILSYIDVLVDGEFVEELKDITLLFRGSRNQRLICLKDGKDVGRYDELVKR